MLRKPIYKRNTGVTAIETALMLLILIPLLFGIVEFSFLFFDQAMITNASREGARVGIVFRHDPNTGQRHPPDGEIIATINQYLQNHLITFGGSSTPSIAIARTGDGPGDSLTVTVSYDYNFLVLPNFVAGLAGGLTLDAETVMRME